MHTDDSLHQHVRTSLLPCGLFFLTLKEGHPTNAQLFQDTCLRANVRTIVSPSTCKPVLPSLIGSASEGSRNRKAYVRRYSRPKGRNSELLLQCLTILSTMSLCNHIRGLGLKLPAFCTDILARLSAGCSNTLRLTLQATAEATTTDLLTSVEALATMQAVRT